MSAHVWRKTPSASRGNGLGSLNSAHETRPLSLRRPTTAIWSAGEPADWDGGGAAAGVADKVASGAGWECAGAANSNASVAAVSAAKETNFMANALAEKKRVPKDPLWADIKNRALLRSLSTRYTP